MRPGRAVITATRPATKIASSMSCVTKSTVFFSASQIPSRSSCMSPRVWLSSAPKGAPSSTTRPDVGASSPATIRNSVDLPQPDGPRIEMKSLSVTVSVVGSSATVGAWPRPPEKVRLTAAITSLLISGEAPEKQSQVRPLEVKLGHEPDHADHDDAEDDLAGVEQRLAV